MLWQPNDPATRKEKVIICYKHSTLAVRSPSYCRQVQQYITRRTGPQLPREIQWSRHRHHNKRLPHLGMSDLYIINTKSGQLHWNIQVGASITHRGILGTLIMSRQLRRIGAKLTNWTGEPTISRGIRKGALDRTIPTLR